MLKYSTIPKYKDIFHCIIKFPIVLFLYCMWVSIDIPI